MTKYTFLCAVCIEIEQKSGSVKIKIGLELQWLIYISMTFFERIQLKKNWKLKYYLPKLNKNCILLSMTTIFYKFVVFKCSQWKKLAHWLEIEVFLLWRILKFKLSSKTYFIIKLLWFRITYRRYFFIVTLVALFYVTVFTILL